MTGILGRIFASVLLCVAAAVHSAGDVEIHQGPRHQRVRAGSPATFTCSAASRSHVIGVPYIEWQRDNRPMHYVKNGHYAKDPVDNSLTIFNTSTADSGYYTCIASLNHHMDKASAQLLVEDVPDPPSDLVVTYCDARVAEIKWKLLNDHHSPITQFIVEYNTTFNPNHWHVAKRQAASDRTYERIALSPWGNYSFRVIAQNSIGFSRPSIHSLTCSTPPDMPHHNPRQVCTNNLAPHSLVIAWELMPREEHNAPGFHYLVKWRRHDLATKKEDHEEKVIDRYTNELTIYNQPIYKPYEIYVLAINEVGEAVAPAKMHIGYSAEDIPLEIPHNFRLNPDKEVSSTTADFLWSPVNTGPWRMQGFFRGYKIEFWMTDEGPASIRYHSIIYRDPELCLVKAEIRHKREVNTGHVYNLWPYTNITAQIRALNSKYEGPPSNRIYFSTKEGEPGPVEHLRVTKKGSHHFDVAWRKPRVVNGQLIGYSIVYEVINSDEIYPKQELDLNDPEMNHIKLTSLVPDQTYRIHLWARTRVGRGQVYQIDERTLPEGPPVAPNFTTVNISKRAINVTWFPSHGGGNPGSVFTLHYRRLGQLQWNSTGQHTDQSWAVVSGLVPGVIYEMRVVAKNGDGEEALETPSPVRRVRIGVRRDLSQPTFKTVYVGETSFGVGLVTYSKAVDSFYVQYRIRGEKPWRTTDDHRPEEWAIVSNLLPGRHYQFRVVTKSDLGESVSLVQEVIAGIDPGTNAQAAISDENAPPSAHGSSNRQFSRDFYQLYCWTFLISVYWQYRDYEVH